MAQLVVLVVALQEQNSPMPQSLPSAADAVSSAANTLVAVARALAQEEYGDYPDISGQVLAAANDVEKASARMVEAVKTVATWRDRQAGWSQLVESCKIIAGKTIILLQLVYGADLYRLFACSDMTSDALRKVEPKQAQSDPQAFADMVSQAGMQVDQLAVYVRAKAMDSESPVLRATLTEMGDLLRQDAVDLINAANKLLQHPNNEALQKEVTDILDRSDAHLKQATAPLQDDLEVVLSVRESPFFCHSALALARGQNLLWCCGTVHSPFPI